MPKLSESQKDYLLEATRKYSGSLKGSPAEAFLAKRGLLRPEVVETVKKFHLGYVSPGDPSPGHEIHRGSLSIPYLRLSPERGAMTVTMRFRCVQDHEHAGHGKYMSQAGDSPALFNTLALLENTPTIALCEGELDAITATACGVPAVGVPGVQSWQDHWTLPLLGYETVYVLADGDDPGMAFANSVARKLHNAKIIPFPRGSDVNDEYVKHGPEAVLGRIRN